MVDPERLRLFQQILASVAEEGSAQEPHWVGDDESLACWSEDLFSASDRTQYLEHLSCCGTCRGKLVELIRVGVVIPPEIIEELPSEKPIPAEKTRHSRRAVRLALWGGVGTLALAVCVLIAVWLGKPQGTESELTLAKRDYEAGHYQLAQDRLERWLQQGLPEADRVAALALLEQVGYSASVSALEHEQFDEVKQQIDHWNQEGVVSARLRNLRWQAERQIPGEYALAHAGSLLDYGYQPDGTRPIKSITSPDELIQEQAKVLLRDAPDDVPTLLNLGQFELSRNDNDEAEKRFRKVLELQPKNAEALNGLGLALSQRNDQEDFLKALQFFERAVAETPKNIDFRINQAVTLERLNRKTDAILIWESLLSEPLSPSRRAALEDRLKTN